MSGKCKKENREEGCEMHNEQEVSKVCKADFRLN